MARTCCKSGLVALLALFVATQALLAAPKPAAEGTGHLQIKCDAGTQLYLDGEFLGVIAEELGWLVAKDVKSGKHVITAVLAGYHAQQANVTVEKDRVTVVDLKGKPMSSAPREEGMDVVAGKAKQEIGTLVIQSLPVECQVSIPELEKLPAPSSGKKLLPSLKTKDKWLLQGLPVNEYEIICTAMDRDLSYVVEVRQGEETHLFFNFIDEEVQDLSQIKRGEQWEKDHFKKSWRVHEVGIEFVWLDELGGWVGKHEVTNAQFRQFKPEHNSGSFKGESLNAEAQPAVNLPHAEAEEFAAWLAEREHESRRLSEKWTFRLPTAKEWRLAAACGDDRVYPWGNEWPPKSGNYNDRAAAFNQRIRGYDDGAKVAALVEASGKNSRGVYGIGGNAAEWTSDYDQFGKYVMVCGGSWQDAAQRLLRCDHPGQRFRPTDKVATVGFRLVLAKLETDEAANQ